MLRYLRENTGNWIIKTFLLIIVVVFVFLGVGSMNAKKRNQVATVNDSPITIKEFQEAYNNMTERLRRQFGDALNEDLLKAFNVKRQAVNSLIDQRLMDMEADKLKILVSDQEVQDALLAVKAFQKDGKFDMNLYKGILARNGMTPESYEAYQRQALKENKLRELVLNSVTVSDAEAKTWYTFQNTKMAIDYIDIDPSSFTDIHPTQEEIEKEYKDHPKTYQSEPQRRVKYLVFSPADHAGKAGITDEQVKAYYEQNINRFKIPEKVEASHILIRLAEDADEAAVEKARKEAMDVYDKAVKGDVPFEELAKTFSQGPSGPKGGYLGVFEHDSMVKPFGDAAFAMKAGEISKPVRTQFGWHIIRVAKRFDAKVESLAEAAAGIKAALEKETAVNLAYDKAGEAFDAVTDGDDLEQVALIAKKKVMETKAFTADGKGLTLPNAARFASEAFSLNPDDISDVKQFGDDYYLIKVVETIDPQPRSLDEVKEDIIVTLISREQKAAAKKKAEALLKTAETAKGTLADLAKANSLEFKSSEPFTRKQPVPGIPSSSALVEAAFTLSATTPLYAKVIEAGNHFYLIGFKEMLVPTADEIQAGIPAVKQEMTARKQQTHFTEWMQAVRDKADISINQDIIN